MQQFVPIIAAGWFETVIGAVVFILYALGHLMMERNKKPPQAPPRAPQPREAAAAPPQQPRTIEDKLRNEVEQFLRQVKGEEPRPTPAKKPVVIVQKPAAVTPLKPQPRESFQESVAKNTSTADVTQHMASLGAEVGLADEKMTAHLQERFQHHVGALEPRQQRPESLAKRNTAAAEFAKLLRSPTGMRQVIIASEILRRPEI